MSAPVTPDAGPPVGDGGAGVDLDFACEEVVADAYAAGPAVVFRMRVTERSGELVHAVVLRCQVRVEPVRRPLSDAEGERVSDLFGDRSRWGSTMQPMQLAFLTQVIPSFRGSTGFDLVMPCSYDVDIAAHKYLAALEDGQVPLLLLFSGTVFAGTPGSIQVLPVPWHKETSVRMPVGVWREAIDQHFPGQAWIRVARPTYDRLAAYRSRRGLVGWDETVEELLGGAEP